VSIVQKPVGPPVEGGAAQRPAPAELSGRFCRIEKLDATKHGAALWEDFRGHDDLWTYSTNGPFADEAAFRTWLEQRAKLADPFYHMVLDKDGKALGVATYMEIRPAMRVIEMGHIVYSPALQRTPIATEAQYLLARHAIETLGYRRYEWKCDSLNAASKRAALRLGFTFEGTFRQHMIVKGRSRNTAWFSIIDREWPRVRTAFEQWLAPENFDGAGKQKRKLEDIRNSLRNVSD
jgi:RimJ/RimL family protein N-acetyltransferase